MADQESFFMRGSHWVRADFHLHTCQDEEFKDDGAKQDFVARYIAALKNAGIRVGVITNHNKFDRDEFMALRKAATKENIYLLPGIELSVKDGANGIHALVVFSESWLSNQEQTDHINGFLGVTFGGQSNYDNSNARSNHDLLDTIRELDKFRREYLLIFAHVETENGLWGGLKGGRIQEMGRNDLFLARTAGFQKVRTRDLRQKVQGWLSGWYPAELEGSDPKAMNEIGRGEKTFAKIGAFTFEAIQFALKPGADRLASAEPTCQPHSWVRSIRYEGGILDGKRFDFSDQLNCLIGIRGSGKSAVLETLRYALELPCDENIADWKYKHELVSFTLRSGGKVIVEAEDAQGRICEVRRILNDRSGVYVENQLRPGVSTQSAVNKPLFFGQKELVPKGEGFERELMEKLLGSRLDSTRRDIATQKQRVIEVLANMDKLKDLDTLEQEYQTKRKDAEFKLELFRKYGVEEQLLRQVDFNADVTNARRAVEVAEAFIRALETFLNDQEGELSAYGRIESRGNADLMNEFNDIFARIRRLPEKGRQLLAELRQEVQALRTKFGELERRRDALKEEFATIERQLSAQLQQQGTATVRPDDFVRLNADLQKAKLAIEEVSKGKARKMAMQDELTKELKTIFEDVIKLVRILKKDIQFIFATHNANFPVLGDAEQVGACAFAGGNANVQAGSIDDPGIQKAIVSIMEGGHEAFARRKEIYQLWKQ